jgi:hypothetical protein
MGAARLLPMAQVVVALMVVVVVVVETLQTDRAGQELLVKAMQVVDLLPVAAGEAVAAGEVQEIQLLAQKTGLHLLEMVVLVPLLIQLCWAPLGKEYWLVERITLVVVVEVAVIKVRFLRVNPLVDMAAAEMLVQTLLLRHLPCLILVVAVEVQDSLVVPVLAVRV